MMDILDKQLDDHTNGMWEDTADSSPEYLVEEETVMPYIEIFNYSSMMELSCTIPSDV